jgi:N-acetylated-alpha-linked acidic dipeptidase
VVRAFGAALEKGWKPQRTIVFASWDGEEYGLVGSTEWVEEYLPWLTNAAVAYINVDVAANGPDFEVAAAPLLNKAIYEVSAEVQSPNQTVAGQTVADLWDGHISTMGSGSDFTAFQDFAGIPSINLEFGQATNGPVYHYHSNYDSFTWMERYGDPGFKYHEAIAKIIALLAAKLAEEPIVGFNATDYAVGLESYLQRMRETTKAEETLGKDVFLPLETAIHAFKLSATSLDAHAEELQAELSSPELTAQQKKSLFAKIHAVNSEYKLLERKFLYQPGLDSRHWFKHVVFAPGLWTGYAGATFPGIVEAIEFGKDLEVTKWVGIVASVVGGAALYLS